MTRAAFGSLGGPGRDMICDNAADWPMGSGEMARRMRDLDWDATPLGAPDAWPLSLRILTEVMLAAKQPMFVTWGADRTTLYNDAYAEILADKHPALGRAIEDIWSEIWEPDLRQIVARAYEGEALHMSDITFQLFRNGAFREAQFSFSYTPVSDAGGRVQGFFCPCLEITDAISEERRARFREGLAETLRRSADPETIAHEAASLLARHLGAEQAAYLEIDEAGELGTVRRDWTSGTLPSMAGTHRLQDFGEAFAAALRAGESIVIPDVGDTGALPIAPDAFAKRGIGAVLHVPHFHDRRLVGVLALNAARPRDWHPADVALVVEVVERINRAVDRARSERSLRESEARLRVSEDRHALLLKLSDAIRDRRDAKDVLHAAAQVFGTHLGVTFAGFAEVDGDGLARTDGQYSSRGQTPAFANRAVAIDSFGRSIAEALRLGQTVIVADMATAHGFTSAEKAAVRGLGVRAFVLSPVLWQGKLEAYLFAASDTPRFWTKSEVDLVRETAERTFSALHRARAEAALIESEARFRALVHSTSDIAFRVSADWTELEHVDALGRPLHNAGSEWISLYVTPEDQPHVRATLDQAIRAKAPVDLEHRWRKPDNTIAWIRMRAVPLYDPSGTIYEWFGASTDITESKRLAHSQRVLLSELDHRVKNILAVVQSIAHQTFRPADGPLPDEARRLLGRISALAESHRLLARSSWQGASFRELVDGAVAPHRWGNADRITVDGPDLQINPRAAQTLVLALHELVTNAAKYGALSRPEGMLSVIWAVSGVEEARNMTLCWSETLGPQLAGAPARRGFGSLLIEHTLAFELEGSAKLDFAPDGLKVQVELPLRNLVPQDTAHPVAAPADSAPASSGSDIAILKGKRVLVVEDEHLVAHETVCALAKAGCEVIGPMPNLNTALASAGAAAPDAAVLDINLGSDLVWPVALLLRAKGVPFVFVTGYAAPVDVPEALQDVLRLEKPLRPDCIIQRLADEVAKSGATYRIPALA